MRFYDFKFPGRTLRLRDTSLAVCLNVPVKKSFLKGNVVDPDIFIRILAAKLFQTGPLTRQSKNWHFGFTE
jgi:hypothetical protein